jgi:hypothetical protein
LLERPGDLVVVHRGVARSAVILCPCGCGEEITINLDRRTGSAWKLYQRGEIFTLFPSVWKESGCASHFIAWNNRILWCDADSFREMNEIVERRVLAALTPGLQSVMEIAEALQEDLWEVFFACRSLVRQQYALEGTGKDQGQFRRAGISTLG